MNDVEIPSVTALAGKVAVTVVLGKGDGAHAITADLYQALGDLGFSIPSQCGLY